MTSPTFALPRLGARHTGLGTTPPCSRGLAVQDRAWCPEYPQASHDATPLGWTKGARFPGRRTQGLASGLRNEPTAPPLAGFARAYIGIVESARDDRDSPTQEFTM